MKKWAKAPLKELKQITEKMVYHLFWKDGLIKVIYGLAGHGETA